MMYESLERKIAKKRKSYQDHREKLMVEFADLFMLKLFVLLSYYRLMYSSLFDQACKNALDSRWAKFQRNASLLRRQLTWQ